MIQKIPVGLRALITSAVCAAALLGLAACDGGSASPVSSSAESTAPKLTYPAAPRGDQVDDYHGEKVADPYRWLEDVDSAQTKAWVEAENKLTFGYLEQIPQRAAIKERLTQLWNFERYGVPAKRGGKYFYTRNDGLQNQAVLYVADTLDAQPRVLLDPNTLLADGTAALVGWEPSEDGKLLAYGIAEAGSDWEIWRVRDVATGKDRADELKWVKWAAATFDKNAAGIYYSRYDEPKANEVLRSVNYFNKVYYHKLGDPQSKDKLVYEKREQKEWIFSSIVTEDGRYLVLNNWAGGPYGTNQILYRDLSKPNAPMVELLMGFDSRYDFIGNEGTRFWFLTELDAPRGRVVEIDLGKPDRAQWKTVIPEASEALQEAHVVGDRFVAVYLKDAASQVKSFALDGSSPRELKVPALSTLAGFHGLRSDPETFYSHVDFVHPGTVYSYNVSTGESKLFKQPKLLINPDDYETKEVFVTSKDGTKVPMFITGKRGLQLDGNNPALMYAYGGFKISITPRFSPEFVAFMEKGGIYAQPSLRGGFEYGQAWHEAGMLRNKQNVFDDFAASAQWLIDNKYTSTPKLAVRGASNSGLLMGAMLTQHPQMWGAVLCQVGVLDMLRFQKFTIGWAWASEYGSSDKPEDFKWLHAYSPLHNVKPGTKFPPTLITTGDHDDRVFPAHSFKFAAAMQNAQAINAPVLIRIETRTGHGQGRPTTKQIELAADQLAFFVKQLNM
ncbi:MAG TPA: prolyl oligopeptidase family serine peptidase [Steroidobacteraceae bacterium]|nr:prolyl oligopeptidase family serine peptidase [Steroidobacteraceae bacterium]